MKGLKKVWRFLRSMRFGVILLLLIAALGIIGSVIEQGMESSDYEAQYGAFSGVITTLGLDRLYSQWYFILLFGLLVVNLLACSLLRGLRLKSKADALQRSAACSALVLPLPTAEQQAWLKKHHFVCREGSAWMRRRLGLAGSFLTHLGLLVLIVAAACVLGFEKSSDLSLPVGGETTLGDGTVVHVDSFTDHDEEGQTEYQSVLTVTLPDGSQQQRTLSVNHPLSFGCYKVYQSGYSISALLDVAASSQEEPERVSLDESAFLTLDGTNGIRYERIYEFVQPSDDGTAVIPVSSYNKDTKPMYLVTASYDGESYSGLVDVGETLTAGGVYVTFLEPLYTTVLQVKERSAVMLGVLYASFVLLLAGLYLCFFHRPIAAVVNEEGISFSAGREVEELLEEWKAEGGRESC